MKNILMPVFLFLLIIYKAYQEDKDFCFGTKPTSAEACFSANLENSDNKCCYHQMKVTKGNTDFSGYHCDEFPKGMTDIDEMKKVILKEVYTDDGFDFYFIKMKCQDYEYGDNSSFLKVGLLLVLGLLF